MFIQGSQTDILFNIIINSKRSYHSYPHVRIILKTGIIVQIEKWLCSPCTQKNSVNSFFCRNSWRTTGIYHTGDKCISCGIPSYILFYIQDIANFSQRLADSIRDLNDSITHFGLRDMFFCEYGEYIVVNALTFMFLNNLFLISLSTRVFQFSGISSVYR